GRAEEEEDPQVRARLLADVAVTYEEKLGSAEHALVAWAQALADAPEDREYIRAVERIATTPDAWNEVLGTLNEAAEEAGDSPAAIPLYLLLGRWYAAQVHRADLALACFAHVLSFDPGNEVAFSSMEDLYRKAQSWQELVALFERRAEGVSSPAAGRDARSAAAEILLQHFSDRPRAEAILQAVLSEDPAHPLAVRLMESLFVADSRWQEVASLLARRAENEGGEGKAATLVRLGEIFEDSLDDLPSAEAQYAAAIEADPDNYDALKGLERIHARTENYKGLLSVLERGLALAPTPRQRIATLERIGSLWEEEFVDREKAISAFASILDIEPGHGAALAALARLQRALQQYDALAATLERHARSVDDPGQKSDLLLRLAETLAVEMGKPRDAIAVCERVLALDGGNSAALELMARLQTSSGDANAAVDVIDRLAEAEKDPNKRAEQFVRAGRLFEERKDHEGAITRFKRALDAVPNHRAASAALRELYSKLGDPRGAADLLIREIEAAEGDLEKAKLQARLGRLYRDDLRDEARAREAFDAALLLDPTCADASRGLGDMAFDAGDFARAARHYEPLLGIASSLDPAEGLAVCLRTGEAFRRDKDYGKAERAYLHAKAIAPKEPAVLWGLADVALAAESWDEALLHYGELERSLPKGATDEERGQVRLRLGQALHGSGDLDGAAKALAEAGATVVLGTWPPAMSIFETLLRRGKMDDARRMADGSLLEFEKVYPLDAEYDRMENVPEEVRTHRRYADRGDFTIGGLADALKADFGDSCLDIVIHALANGSEVKNPLLETSRKGYLSAVGASAYSNVSLIQHMGPLMREGGACLSLTYLAAERAVPGYGGGMSSAKAALESDTRILAFEAGRKWGIRVNTISAGPLASRAASAIGFIGQMIEYYRQNTPIPEALTAWEVGTTAAFLCSALGSGITGATIHVDKGYHAMAIPADVESILGKVTATE
ncbi:MAG: enoyl-[acyl-carrier-protein] reductase, partial [Myxococcales bacterium]|nr:enoyl-[acyl-carrier-protein] reductase [Myxococcales bacterium]